MGKSIQLHDSWLSRLQDEFSKDYMLGLRAFLSQEKQQGKTIFPPGKDIFNALDSCPFDQVKVVILGQDPYHGQDQAHGLCFSVQAGTATPPSLKNIYKELQQDVDTTPVKHGHLMHWAQQGVLLLNSVLTVQAGQAGSHQGKGWEEFTDAIIALLNARSSNVVFLLWGSYAQKKGAIIDRNRHLVLQSPHPSPLSAHRGFFGNGHFSKTNTFLQQAGLKPIDWQLPESP